MVPTDFVSFRCSGKNEEKGLSTQSLSLSLLNNSDLLPSGSEIYRDQEVLQWKEHEWDSGEMAIQGHFPDPTLQADELAVSGGLV